MVLALAAAGAAAIAITSVAWPLATYTVSLAVFGLAHVLTEIRFVDEHYGQGLGRTLRRVLAVLLSGVAGIRLLQYLGHLPTDIGRVVEVALVLLLTLSVVPGLRHARLGTRAVVAGVVLLLVAGFALSPVHTLLFLAVTHNLTPLGFLADRLPPAHWKWAMALALALFLGVPLFIASGIPWAWLAPMGLSSADFTPFPAGPLAQHLGAYLHSSFHARPWAVHAFSAVVFAQCMHYAVVIHVLPRLPSGGTAVAEPSGTVPWPSHRVFTAVLVALSALLVWYFYRDFKAARALYGVVAAVHAWVEIPILLLALMAATRTGLATAHSRS